MKARSSSSRSQPRTWRPRPSSTRRPRRADAGRIHHEVAIIRPDRLNEVLEALYRAEVTGLTVSRVLGHGGETDRVETYAAPP